MSHISTYLYTDAQANIYYINSFVYAIYFFIFTPPHVADALTQVKHWRWKTIETQSTEKTNGSHINYIQNFAPDQKEKRSA